MRRGTSLFFAATIQDLNHYPGTSLCMNYPGLGTHCTQTGNLTAEYESDEFVTDIYGGSKMKRIEFHNREKETGEIMDIPDAEPSLITFVYGPINSGDGTCH